MGKGSSAKWPVYRGRLRTPLDPTANLAAEIPARLSALCTLYGVDQRDPVWERKLLMTLAHRHVKGFCVKRRRRATVDSVGLIELVDSVRDHFEEIEGRKPSAEAAIAFIFESPDAAAWFGSMRRQRALRIYSGRREVLDHATREAVRQGNEFAKVIRQELLLDQAPVDCHARILRDIIRRRHS